MSVTEAAPARPGLYSSRQVAGLLVTLIGLAFLASALICNPWVARVAMGTRYVDVADTLAGYCFWSLVLGAVTVLLGVLVGRGQGPRWLDGLTLAFLILGGFFLADRFLLTRYALPLYEYDAKLEYRLRPGIVRSQSAINRPDALIRVNRWGFTDTEFPRSKPTGEFRGLMLGDSVTMGYGLTYPDTFSAQLERLLDARDLAHRSHQIINAGVHGYATYQELEVFRRSLNLDPDLVALGFCMNDVVEPFVVSKRFGGVGLDYHGVFETPNPLTGYLLNETGFGRLAQRLMQRSKRREAEKLTELYNVRSMVVGSRTMPRFIDAWKIVLDDLERIYSLAAAHHKPIVLLIFPFTMQLNNPAMREPQAILREHARRHGVDFLDFTDDFARRIFDDPEVLDLLRRKGYDPDEIRHFYRWKIDEYFLDQDHFTPRGHAVVAERLFQYLEEAKLVRTRTDARLSDSPSHDPHEPPSPAATRPVSHTNPLMLSDSSPTPGGQPPPAVRTGRPPGAAVPEVPTGQHQQVRVSGPQP